MDNQTGYGIGQGIGALLKYLIGRKRNNFNSEWKRILEANDGNTHDAVAYVATLPETSNVRKNFKQMTGFEPDATKFTETAAQSLEKFARSVANGTVDTSDPLYAQKMAMLMKFQGNPMSYGGPVSDVNQRMKDEAKAASDQNTRANIGTLLPAGFTLNSDVGNKLLGGGDNVRYPGQTPPIDLPVPPQTAGGIQPMARNQPIVNPGVGFGSQGTPLSQGPLGDINQALASISAFSQKQNEKFGGGGPVTGWQLRPQAAMKTAEAAETKAGVAVRGADLKDKKFDEIDKPESKSKIDLNTQKIAESKAKEKALYDRINNAHASLSKSAYAKTEDGQILLEQLKTARALAVANLKASVTYDYNASDQKSKDAMAEYEKHKADIAKIVENAEKRAKEKATQPPAMKKPGKVLTQGVKENEGASPTATLFK